MTLQGEITTGRGKEDHGQRLGRRKGNPKRSGQRWCRKEEISPAEEEA